MEIREFAQNVLLGGSLEEKLLVPAEFSDAHPDHSLLLPDFPAREKAIRFGQHSRGPAFPVRDSLRGASERGVAMHVFAHHELMALELMALALLKLTSAPRAFRLGIAETMLEEQEHFSAYRARGEELGVGFGELPLSGFFWNALHGISSPIDYVTQISMTFEQANLDFAEFYEGLFEDVGDRVCARIMRKVYEDEVGHVAYGLQWFNRLRPGKESTWEAYRRALPPRLSPSWAKGIGFCERGRRAAGLDEEFVREVRLYSRSKGRPPRVFISNPDAAALPSFGGESYARPEQIEQVGRDLAPSLLFSCNPSDVLVSERPDLSWLERLGELGVSLPEFVAWGEVEENLCTRNHVWSIDPWCRSARTNRLAECLGDRLMNEASVGSEELERCCSAFSERILAQSVLPGTAGASESSAEHGSVDLRFSVCGSTQRRGDAQTIVRRIGDAAGRFAGYLIERPLAGLDAGTITGLYRGTSGASVFARMGKHAQSAHEELGALGYRGPFGLHFSVRSAGDGELHPCLHELHTGIHMDGTAAALRRLVQRKKVGVWLHLESEQIRSAGFESPAALMAHLDAALPAEEARTPGTVRLRRGALPTTCPVSSVHRFAVLLVAESLEALGAALPGGLAALVPQEACPVGAVSGSHGH